MYRKISLVALPILGAVLWISNQPGSSPDNKLPSINTATVETVDVSVPKRPKRDPVYAVPEVPAVDQDASVAQKHDIPEWADASQPAWISSAERDGIQFRYTAFTRKADLAPIVAVGRSKVDAPDEILSSMAFHGRRLLVDTVATSGHPALQQFQQTQSRQGTVTTLHLEASDDPFVALRIAEELIAAGVPGVEFDVLAHTATAPNDPSFSSQWHLRETSSTAHIDAERAWQTRTSASNTIVAILDTGVRLTHQDLDDNLWINPGEIAGDNTDNDNNGYIDDVHGIDSNAGTGNPDDVNGHGTHCAGIIGAEGNNGIGVSGVAWDVELMAIRFMDDDGIGYLSDAIEGFDYASNHGADVINCSFTTSSYSSLFYQAVVRAQEAGMIVVAAAGNEATDLSDRASFPAAYSVENIVSVTSTDSDGGISSFSNYSNTLVDLAAPGRNILATYSNSDTSYQSLSGTSMATPVVAGILALARAEYPSDSIADLIQRLENGVIEHSELTSKTRTGGYVSLFNTLFSVDPNLLPSIQFDDTGPVVLPAGYSASITASTSNDSDASISWEKDDTPLSGSTKTFTWQAPTSEDSGRYTVTITNEYGSDTASIDINFLDSDSSIAHATEASSLPWITYGDSVFTANGNSIESGSISHNESVSLQTRAPSEGTLLVDIEVSSEANYDFLHIRVDNQTVASYAGTVSLDDFEIELSEVGQTIVFTYEKDATVTRGSDSITLSEVRFQSANYLQITQQPNDLVLINEAPAEVDFAVENAEDSSFLWKRDSATVSITNTPSNTFYIDREPTLGEYQVFITKGDSTLVTDTFTVSNVSTPVITATTESSSAELGSRVTLSVIATGSNLAYQWVKDNRVISNGMSATLTLNSVSSEDAGVYWVVVSNEAGSVSSSSIQLDIQGNAPAITSHPESQVASAGQTVDLAVIATGEGTLLYQWYFNGAAIDGANEDTYTINSVNSLSVGSYSCAVSNSIGSTTSNLAVVEIADQTSATPIVSIGDLEFQVIYSNDGAFDAASHAWSLEISQTLLLRATAPKTGVYAFEFQQSDVDVVWRVNGADAEVYQESTTIWLKLKAGDIIDCMVSLHESSLDKGEFSLSDVVNYLAAEGPVVLAPDDLQTLTTTQNVEEVMMILSNTPHRIEWSLTPLDINQQTVKSVEQLDENSADPAPGYYMFSGTVENEAGTFELPEFYVNYISDTQHPFTEAEDLGDGWILDPSFGALNIGQFPWVYSVSNGWWYIDPQTSSDTSMWLFDMHLGWLETSTEAYPCVWSRTRGGTYYFHAGSSNLRWIYDFIDERWFSTELSQVKN